VTESLPGSIVGGKDSLPNRDQKPTNIAQYLSCASVVTRLMNEEISLTDLGYNDSFEAALREYAELEGCSPARVTAEHKGAYVVKDEEGEYFATVTGKHMHEASSRADYPAVGDWVVIAKTSEDKAVINHILPRKTQLKKKYSSKDDTQIIAANVDCVFIVESLDRDYNLNRFERYFVLAKEGGVTPVAILNKTDLVSFEDLESIIQKFKERFEDVPLVCTTTHNDEALSELRAHIKAGQTYSFLGSSGVGKSSLINSLLGTGKLEVGDIGEHAGRGKHTTTARAMYVLPGGGVVIDNPGTRGVGVVEAERGVEDVFDEITDMSASCKYSNCTHTQEPGCAVLKAVAAGELEEQKYQNYIRLTKENEHYEMNDLEKRRKDRTFGKFIKNSKKDLKKFKQSE